MGEKKKKLEKIVVDGADTSEMKFSKLQEFSQILLMKLNTARKDRNFLQAQCAQMRTAWEMTKQKLQDSKYRIKATAMNRDKMEVDVCGQVIKEMNEQSKFINFTLTERLDNMKSETQEILKDIETKWDQSTLQPMLDQKTQLKLKVEQENEDMTNNKKNFQFQIDNDITDLVNKMESESNAIIEHQVVRLNNYLYNLKLISNTAFFRTQEEYNRIIRELMENGRKNTDMMREFYKRITEDDIIIIMVLEKQVRKLKKIVKKKHFMCKKINEQSATIESSKGELEMNLRRAERKMKLYDTNTLALDRANYQCDKLVEKKQENAKGLKEIYNKENEITEQVKEMEDYLNCFHEMFETRQREVFEPLKHKIHILKSLIKKDKETIEKLVPTLPDNIQEKAKKEWNSSDQLTLDCMSRLIFDLAKLCSTHDNLVDFVERSLVNISLPQAGKPNFKRMNFDVTTYGLGPVGELISKYP